MSIDDALDGLEFDSAAERYAGYLYKKPGRCRNEIEREIANLVKAYAARHEHPKFMLDGAVLTFESAKLMLEDIKRQIKQRDMDPELEIKAEKLKRKINEANQRDVIVYMAYSPLSKGWGFRELPAEKYEEELEILDKIRKDRSEEEIK